MLVTWRLYHTIEETKYWLSNSKYTKPGRMASHNNYNTCHSLSVHVSLPLTFLIIPAIHCLCLYATIIIIMCLKKVLGTNIAYVFTNRVQSVFTRIGFNTHRKLIYIYLAYMYVMIVCTTGDGSTCMSEEVKIKQYSAWVYGPLQRNNVHIIPHPPKSLMSLALVAVYCLCSQPSTDSKKHIIIVEVDLFMQLVLYVT